MTVSFEIRGILNKAFEANSYFLTNKYWERVLMALTCALCCLYITNIEAFNTLWAAMTITLLSFRVVHYIVVNRYMLLIDLCYLTNLLTVYNVLSGGNTFLLYFGTMEGFYIMPSVIIWKFSLNFDNVKDFTCYFIHVMPAIVHLQFILDGSVDFSSVNYLFFAFKATIMILSYYLAYYLFTFCATYDYWKRNRCANLFVLNQKKFPFRVLKKGLDERRAGILFVVILGCINLGSLPIWYFLSNSSTLCGMYILFSVAHGVWTSKRFRVS